MARPLSPTVDKTVQPSFMRFIKGLADLENGIRFFDRKEYYTVHGSHALFISRTFFKTVSAVKYWGTGSGSISPSGFGSAFKKRKLQGGEKLSSTRDESGLASIVVSQNLFETIIPDMLLHRSMKIEVWAGSGGDWHVARRASPGDMEAFAEILGDSDASVSASGSCVVGVKLGGSGAGNGGRQVGVAVGDLSGRRMHVAQFTDSEQFGVLATVLAQSGARECYIEDFNETALTSHDNRAVCQLLRQSNIMINRKKSSLFKPSDFHQDMLFLLKGETVPAFVRNNEFKLAIDALSCVVHSLGLLSNSEYQNEFEIAEYDLKSYMRIDAACVKALGLLPPRARANSHESVYGILNVCGTVMGSRLLQRWIRMPLLDVGQINERLDIVECFVNYRSATQLFREDLLKRIPDVYRIARKLGRKAASLQDCVRLYQLAVRLPVLVKGFANFQESEHYACVKRRLEDPLKQSCEHLGTYEKLIETAIDLDSLANNEFLINPEYDPELGRLGRDKDELFAEMAHELDKTVTKIGIDAPKLKLERNSVLGHYFRVSRKDEKLIRGKGSILTLETRKDGVRFSTPRLRQLSTRYGEISEQYESIQLGLEKKTLEVAATYCPAFLTLSSVIAELDVFIGFAEASVAAAVPYVRPVMHAMEDSRAPLRLVGSRHPCVEGQDSVDFVSNDLSLVGGETEFLVITGPNMGGKSTYIRQVGVICVMAQIGCFVPCSEASLTVRDRILCRVGAADSLTHGISTFMAEMLDVAQILKSATKNSLVIIDELGRGTSTYDGFGLAWAISEHIISKIHCFSMFATHFHELTALQEKHEKHVKNFHVAARVVQDESGGEQLVLLHRVRPGPCDRSFGIHIAKMAKFPEEVLKNARRKAAELEDFSSSPDGESGFQVDGASAGGSTSPPTMQRARAALTALAESGTQDFSGEIAAEIVAAYHEMEAD